MKFLIVEDEEGLRNSIDHYLTAEGNICDWASNYELRSTASLDNGHESRSEGSSP